MSDILDELQWRGLVAQTTEAERQEFAERAERAGYTVRYTPVT